MTHIHTHQKHHDLEEQGEIELVLVALEYVGGRTIENTPALQDRGGWQGPVRWNPGQTRIGFVPDWAEDDYEQDRHVANIENMGKFNVIYDPERIAEILLQKNYLPPNVFGQAHDRRVRRRFLEEMGMEPAGIVYDRGDEEPYRKQLRDIAGIETEGDKQAQDAVKTDAEEYKNRKRSNVETAAEILGYEDDVSTAQKQDLAEFIAGFSRDVAVAALRGEEVDLSGDEPEVIGADEPADLDELDREGLKEIYQDLGGKSEDPEGDDVHLGKKSDLKDGIRRIRSE